MKTLFFLALMVCATQAAEIPGSRLLFNGRDLSGWMGDGYAVEDGSLICTPQGKVLMTEETFADYELDFEFQLAPGANNGLGIHYPGKGDAAYTGMEIQILDNAHPKIKELQPDQLHGGLYKLSPSRQGALKPAGNWNRQRVKVVGAAVQVELNGQIILQADLETLAKSHPEHDGLKRRSGHLAWLGHGDRVAFRNIRILEIPPIANDRSVKAAGFTRLIDQSNLPGWKPLVEGSGWQALGVILKSKPGTQRELWTEKSYRNFTMVFDWRWSARGVRQSTPLIQPDGLETNPVEIEWLDSGIALRGSTNCEVNLWSHPIGSGEVPGYGNDLTLDPAVRASLVPKVHADRPIGEWNRGMIILKDKLLSVSFNGRVVIENAAIPNLPESGPIGLRQQGSPIDFANVWIKED